MSHLHQSVDIFFSHFRLKYQHLSIFDKNLFLASEASQEAIIVVYFVSHIVGIISMGDRIPNKMSGLVKQIFKSHPPCVKHKQLLAQRK